MRELFYILQQAGLKWFQASRQALNLRLKVKKSSAKFIAIQYLKAKEAKVNLELKDLRNYHWHTGNNKEKTENIVQILIGAKRSNIKTDIEKLGKFENSGGNPAKLIEAQKNIKNASLDIPINVLETLSMSGGDITVFVKILLKAQKANLELDLPKLVNENLSDENMDKVVNVLIKALKAGLFITHKEEANIQDKNTGIIDLRISQKNILDHLRVGIDIEKYISAMIIAKKAGISIDKEALDIHYLTNGDMEKLVKTFIKAEKSGLDLNQKEISEYNIEGRDIGSLIKNLIKARQAGLNLSLDEIIEYYRMKGDASEFINALIRDKEQNLGIGKKELGDHFSAGVNLKDYIKVREILKNSPDIDLSTEEINNHYLKGGNIAACVFAILYAKQHNLNISPQAILATDLLPNLDVNKMLEWAVNPQTKEVTPCIPIVTKDGIQVIPKLKVSLRGIISNYYRGSNEEVLFERINEALTHEIAKCNNHHEVLNNLSVIAKKIQIRLAGKLKTIDNISSGNKFEIEDEIEAANQKEILLNKSSKYEILDIKIYDLEIGKDTLAEHKIHHAKHEAHLAEIHYKERIIKAQAEKEEAEAQLVKSKVALQKGMAEALKNGTFNYSQYQKDRLLFEENDNAHQRHGHEKHNDGHGHGLGHEHGHEH